MPSVTTPVADPLAAALNDVPGALSNNQSVIEQLYGDRPAALEAILAAKARGVSGATIAKRIIADTGVSISGDSVNKWCRAQEARKARGE